MKDSKLVLKEARDAIKNKNYETALKLCKQILKEEKNNYMALVFLGVSLQETGQNAKALKAFQEAIEANPSNPLAWNGLINYYEKIDTKETKLDLINAYISLIGIETGEKKILECVQKLANLCEFGDLAKIVTAIFSVLKEGKCDSAECAVCLINILSKIENLAPDLVPIYEETLKLALNNQKTVCTKYFSDYLNLLYKQDKAGELLQQAKKMHEMFESDWISLRWICKIFNEVYVESGTLIESVENMANYSESLSKLEAPSATGLFTQSILLVEQKKIIEAKDVLEQVVGVLPGLVHAWVLLLKCCMQLLLYDEAINAANKLEKLLQNKKILKKSVNVLMVEVLSRSEEEADLRKALQLFENIETEVKSACNQHLIRANINLKKFTEAKSLLQEFNSTDKTHILLKAQLLHKQEKFSEALEILERENCESCEWWLEIGSLYWDCGHFDKSLIPFLKATKLDPNNYKCFLFLGHFYKRNNDFDKARRCYEKAFKINKRCAEAGIELSKIYRKLKNWDANLNLLQALTSGIINAKNSWAWMQLGLHHLEQLDYDKAVTNLRFVIRIDENNAHCWESLADAYLAKGAYTSALKCYEKTSSLVSEAWYPMLQKGHIKQILGEFAEARLEFEEILKFNKFYVPALKGMAETCLLQARHCYKDQRLGTSRDHAQVATDHLIRALSQRGDLSCLWKLLGNGCLFVANLPEKHSCLLIAKKFVEGRDVVGDTVLEKSDLFALAARCFFKSLGLVEDNFLIWHDLAVCYLSHGLSSGSSELITKAQTILQHCTANNPTYWPHWNLLGNVAMHLNPPNYKFAQHCFIKAVIADSHSAVSWTNLGTLYFLLGDFKLANQAFSQAQRSDPNYVNSWIGQALLAETLAHEDAMDLFRHSTQLRVHKQGALGYAHWVCKTLKESPVDTVVYSIHNMHAVPVACDVITWYTEHDPMNATAWNMLGILKERMGLKLGALEAFKNALTLSDKKQRDLARVNYGRLLAALGKYQQAVDSFTKVEAATFNSGSGLALALFKDKLYKESYEVYESTLHWLSDDSNLQSNLLVALASMAYMFEGPEAAKTLLFQSIQLENPSPWGFYAISSLGLLHDDFNLTDLVLSELKKIISRSCGPHFAVLASYFHLLQGKNKQSVCEVSKIVFMYPDQAPVWATLSSVLIRVGKDAKAAANCAQIAMKLGQATNTNVTKILCLVALSFLIVGDTAKALLMAQKAIHCYPNLAEGWAVFIAALVRSKRTNRVPEFLKIAQQLNPCEKLKLWMDKI
ncbi:superkiller complex protein 3 [Tribolium castaneum]|uniref:superkiller complex protein 3 n=1 Tax=Tribolium castaneum TaxID=7070 RepID=UPI00046C0779|nr:PREDICTED: tetratricopeptide repeat protein 37 [Tribolium castaneum]|eukprot:XP_008195456.1 PREDICTED: tetratricopeptide repeat protein 37 [Tribolium castaneum]